MILARICEHNEFVIKDGKPTNVCKACQIRHFGYQNGISEKKHFNRTLQKEFNSYGEAEKFAKSKGLAPIGNEPLSNIFNNDDRAKKADETAREQRDRLNFDRRRA